MTAPARTEARTAVAHVSVALDRIAASERPEVWIHLREPVQTLAEAHSVDERVASGERLPLAGTTIAVKDNIDVAGLPTSAGCPAFVYLPQRDAAAVRRLRAAGAIVLGKTNMDQFATGLVGTRSPYGAVRDARRPQYISGGSSSGSAVAVALGLADLGLGTDTAGSGRVPAAFQGLVGIKPTRGLIPTDGVVPASRTLDCVSVFAGRFDVAVTAAETMWSGSEAGRLSRRRPQDAPLAAPPAPHVAVPAVEQLTGITAAGRRAFTRAASRLEALGARLVEIDLAPFLQAGRMLYEGAFVAERFSAVGKFIAEHGEDIDPVVARIVLEAGSIPAHVLVSDMARLELLHAEALESLGDATALLLPTAPKQPTILQVAEHPTESNRDLGTYTNFCNLFDMCAVALPAGEADGGNFGITLMAPAFHDMALGDLARRFTGEPERPAPAASGGEPGIGLFVVGAHLSGQPLNHELTGRGGRLRGPAHTALDYRLFALDTDPPKPGLVRSARGAGSSIAGELWALPPAGLASLLAKLPTPMTLGRVELTGGLSTVGFLCEPAALAEAEEITHFGSWPGYLARSI